MGQANISMMILSYTARHIKVVQDIFKRFTKKGISISRNMKDITAHLWDFLYQRQLNEEGCCPDCSRPLNSLKKKVTSLRCPNIRTTFKIYRTTTLFRVRRNKMINFIKQGLEDLCVSRTTFDWEYLPINKKTHLCLV